ncbi:response regulator [Sphingobacterium spiritivorum]|uniref:response regulator n=1 Tax=Sphingobacterium spiritivorum TaxID=258 RepID=UPI00191ADE1E|nr:response regulator [Sphingobacterium spiritivorum]QQT24658.1 response regulator [Sphingobacterium spiritivorum]
MIETLRIAIVDDDIIFRLIFSKMLENFSELPVQVQVFENGLEALNYFRLYQHEEDKLPHILFVDIDMPFLSGWEMMDEIMQEGINFVLHIPVYILSSSTSTTDKQKIHNYVFINEYIEKPITKDRLFGYIKEYLADNQ